MLGKFRFAENNNLKIANTLALDHPISIELECSGQMSFRNSISAFAIEISTSIIYRTSIDLRIQNCIDLVIRCMCATIAHTHTRCMHCTALHIYIKRFSLLTEIQCEFSFNTHDFLL